MRPGSRAVPVRKAIPVVAGIGAALAACAAVALTPDPRIARLDPAITAPVPPQRLAPLAVAAHESPRLHALSVSPDLTWDERDLALTWVHPLAGPRRELPINATRRFGAERPGERNAECRRGHCGVDLGQRKGTIVHASADGTIARIVWSANAGSGRYVKITHPSGFSTWYMHLDKIRSDLRVGDEVIAGAPLGTVGRTGIKHSAPHLHFGVSRAVNGRERFLDPEPMLREAVVLPKPAPFTYRQKPAL